VVELDGQTAEFGEVVWEEAIIKIKGEI